MPPRSRVVRWQLMLELLGSGAFRELWRWTWKRVSSRFWHKCYVCRKSYAYYCLNSSQANDGLHRSRYKVCKNCCVCPAGHTSRPPAERKVPTPSAPTKSQEHTFTSYKKAPTSGIGDIDNSMRNSLLDFSGEKFTRNRPKHSEPRNQNKNVEENSNSEGISASDWMRRRHRQISQQDGDLHRGCHIEDLE
ncbi:hypothetical protein Ddc_01416 [Ditylenchus destructor]|nr:hypothetical protein Ddc_01416 [Ditylenchus destructor]